VITLSPGLRFLHLRDSFCRPGRAEQEEIEDATMNTGENLASPRAGAFGPGAGVISSGPTLFLLPTVGAETQ